MRARWLTVWQIDQELGRLSRMRQRDTWWHDRVNLLLDARLTATAR
jgi:hypothetical protein